MVLGTPLCLPFGGKLNPKILNVVMRHGHVNLGALIQFNAEENIQRAVTSYIGAVS